MKNIKIIVHAFAVPILLLSMTQCNKTVPQDDEESPKPAKADNLASEATPKPDETSLKLDYPKQYCENVRRISIRTNIDSMIEYICAGKSPSKEFLELRTKAMNAKPGDIQLSTIKINHNEETQKSEFVIVWAFHVPLRPFEVKGRPIYQYVAQGYTSETITLASKFELQPDTTLDPGGLHLWSVKLNHDLVIKGSSNLNLASARNTEYNLYQVLSGNEEMGLGIEHMTDTGNPSYDASTMANFSFNDGGGFNDGKGGTVVVTMLHFIIGNSGFPKTATDSIAEIAKNIADGMYNGLKQ